MDRPYHELPRSALAAFRWRGRVCWLDDTGLWLASPEDRGTSRILNRLSTLYRRYAQAWEWDISRGDPVWVEADFICSLVAGEGLWARRQREPYRESVVY